MSTETRYAAFQEELQKSEAMVSAYLHDHYAARKDIRPSILELGTMSYLKGGKKLRPAVLMLACGAVGGDKQKALPAAAAVELFHTWTLVHDDIIDNDAQRRGVDTVHIAGAKHGKNHHQLSDEQAEKYGRDVAILTGDIQHGWCISLLSEGLMETGVDPVVILKLITELETRVLRTLVEGEMLDVDFGLTSNANGLEDEQIIDMLWKKTGILYEFAGLAGGLLGKNQAEPDEEIHALKDFCSLCGTAFQIRDDVLGIVGKAAKLGKPVGSDIREGKKTLIVKEALRNAKDVQSEKLLQTLGNAKASSKDIDDAIQLLVDLGGVEKARGIANGYIERAVKKLEVVRPSPSKDLLYDWAQYLIDRNH